MFGATLTEAQVLGYVVEEISDARSNQVQKWHRLDLRDPESGQHLYVTLPETEKSLLDQAAGLKMGDRVVVEAALMASVTPTGGQKLKLRAVTVKVVGTAQKAAA